MVRASQGKWARGRGHGAREREFKAGWHGHNAAKAGDDGAHTGQPVDGASAR